MPAHERPTVVTGPNAELPRSWERASERERTRTLWPLNGADGRLACHEASCEQANGLIMGM